MPHFEIKLIFKMIIMFWCIIRISRVGVGDYWEATIYLYSGRPCSCLFYRLNAKTKLLQTSVEFQDVLRIYLILQEGLYNVFWNTYLLISLINSSFVIYMHLFNIQDLCKEKIIYQCFSIGRIRGKNGWIQMVKMNTNYSFFIGSHSKLNIT